MDWDYHAIQLDVQQGWVCPLCGRANAPWVSQCNCMDVENVYGSSYTYKIDYTREATSTGTGNQIIYKYNPLNTAAGPSSVTMSSAPSEDSHTDVKTAKVDYTEEMTTTDIPTACKTCLNHPSNGGDGNCFCGLGTLGITF